MPTNLCRHAKIALLVAALCAPSNFSAAQANPYSGFVERMRHLKLSEQAISENSTEANAAIQDLRAAGPEGMYALGAAHENTLRDAYSHPEKKQTAEWKRLINAFEKVGAQRDNWASRLYWFTDLEAAKAEAKKDNKPILSLRLLGNLDEELSCANSRFFRTALYPNARIKQFLQTHYILHWQSVRPVPKVTVDFGDGRKIETTITGNSIHYALDEQGRVLDALPGLYSPGAFFKWIERAQSLNTQSLKLEGAARETRLKNFHDERLSQITREWQNDIGQTKIPASAAARILTFIPPRNAQRQNVHQTAQALQTPRLQAARSTPFVAQSTPFVAQSTPFVAQSTPFVAQSTPAAADETLMAIRPTARNAAPLALAKRILEMPLLQAMTVAVPRDRDALVRQTDDALWEKIAALHLAEAVLDNQSLEVLRTKTARSEIIAANFQKSIAEDSVRNEYSRHAIIHQWLNENPNFGLNALNKKVYTELFLTPDSDPWLGLLPAEAYTAIPNNGVSN